MWVGGVCVHVCGYEYKIIGGGEGGRGSEGGGGMEGEGREGWGGRGGREGGGGRGGGEEAQVIHILRV